MTTGGTECVCETGVPVLAERMNWYAIQTYPQNEKKVVAELQLKGIPTFLPLKMERHQWSDRRKLIEVPVFPCYAFVQGVASAAFRQAVARTPRMIRLLGTNEPVPVPDAEIDSLRILVSSNATFSPCAFLKAGQRIRIRGGCMDGLEGVFVSRDGEDKLVVSVSLIQRSLTLNLRGYDIEPVH
jgi:transcription antitermination factor NusG